MYIELKKIDKNTLKVGDVVGVARKVGAGYISSFRHDRIIPATITRSHRREQKLRQINSATMTGMKNSMNITIMQRKRMSWQRNFAR